MKDALPKTLKVADGIQLEQTLVPTWTSHRDLIETARAFTSRHEHSDLLAEGVVGGRKITASEVLRKLREHATYVKGLSSTYHEWSDAPRRNPKKFRDWQKLAWLVRDLDDMHEETRPLLEKFEVMSRNTDFKERICGILGGYARVVDRQLYYHLQGQLGRGKGGEPAFSPNFALSKEQAFVRRLQKELRGKNRRAFLDAGREIMSEASVKLAGANAYLNGIQAALQNADKHLEKTGAGQGVSSADLPSRKYVLRVISWLKEEQRSAETRIAYLEKVHAQLDLAINVVKLPRKKGFWR